MAGYAPLFDSITTGTLYGKWPDIGLWPIILAIGDKRGIVDVTPQYIAGVTGLPVDEVIACMARFCQPDQYSRTPTAEGRRLELLEPGVRSWGWRIVNHGFYREKARIMAKDAARTESGEDAERKRKGRANSPDVPRCPPMSPDVPRCPPRSPEVPLSNANANTEKEYISDLRSSVEQVFEHWRKTWNHPSAKLDAKRRKRIEARLNDFSAEQLCQAISGFRNSPWHCGTDPKGNGVVYDGIETLLRDTAQVEKGIALWAHPPAKPNGKPPGYVEGL